MKRKILLSLFFGMASLICFGEEINKHELISLSHVKGFQSVGIRGGHGTKNLFDVGLTYTYCFSNRLALLVEVDHERWKNGRIRKYDDWDVEHVNYVMLSPGIEHIILNPNKWFFWHWGIGGAIGYDRWKSRYYRLERKGLVYGAQVGTGVEFMPFRHWSFVLKGQQYVLFSKPKNYLKPNFSLAFRYNFHK